MCVCVCVRVRVRVCVFVCVTPVILPHQMLTNSCVVIADASLLQGYNQSNSRTSEKPLYVKIFVC